MLKTRKEEIIKEEPEDEFVPQPKLMKLKHLMNSFWPMWSKRKIWPLWPKVWGDRKSK